MKVMYVNTLYPPHIGGGAEISLHTLAQAVSALGHEVVVATTAPTSSGVHEDSIDNIRVMRTGIHNVYWQKDAPRRKAPWRILWHLRDTWNPAMAGELKRLIRMENPDIVSCHNLAGWSIAAWDAVRSAGKPLVHVIHDLYLFCANSNMYRNGQRCTKQCQRCRFLRRQHVARSNAVDGVVGVSQFILRKHLSQGFFSNARIRRAIYDARAMTITSEDSPIEPPRGLRFGYLGTLSPAKGLGTLLDAFAQLSSCNAELRIAGTGQPPYVRELHRRAAGFNIRFLGFVNPQEFLRAIDVLIVPSEWEEALGMVVPEAFAHGVPVIASRRGGLPELVRNGENGFLFDSGSTVQLTRLMENIYHDGELLSVLRSRALGSAAPFVDVQSWAHRHLEVYTQLTNCSTPNSDPLI